MNKVLGGIALSALLTLPVMAADIPVKAGRPAAAVAVWSWTGCYVGVHGGYQRSRINSTYGANVLGIAPGTATSEPLRIRGGAIGPTVGCNYQAGGNWVVGVEGDYDFVEKSDSRIETAFPAFRVRVEQRWLATVRGRIGYAMDRGFLIPVPVLYYLTGGGAWASMDTANFVPGAIARAEQTQTYSGWTAGFGSEYAVGGNWSIKSETLYVRLGAKSNFTVADPVSGGVFDTRPRSIWISKVGLNYRFNLGGGPVVARY